MAIRHWELGKTQENVSQLGFGCMRLPLKADGKIDFELTEKMLDYAYANGVNYFDTAYPYLGGESEVVTGKILSKYPRESFYITTKLLLFGVKTLDDAKKLFETQMERLNLGYIDNYIFHGINRDLWEGPIKKCGLLDYLCELKAQGRIKHIGFSFHDDYSLFEEVVNSFDWELCQIQYNYMDRNIQAGDKGVELCGRKGIPLVIMEPVKGGALARLPAEIEQEFKAYDKDASAASWAMRWVGSCPEVKIVLSGMSTMEQVEDNVKTFSDFKPMNKEEYAIIEKAHEMFAAREKIGCTSCGYCMPCPVGVNIPKSFQIWNESSKFPEMNGKGAYNFPGKWQARYCIECGKCEEQCPQHLNIRESLKEVERLFG